MAEIAERMEPGLGNAFGGWKQRRVWESRGALEESEYLRTFYTALSSTVLNSKAFRLRGMDMGILKIACCASLMLVTGCLFSTKSGSDLPGVCGTVRDAETQAPIANAKVAVQFCLDSNEPATDQQTEYTDTTGWFHMNSTKCPGKFQYMIRITKASYDSFTEIQTQTTNGLVSDCADQDFDLRKTK